MKHVVLSWRLFLRLSLGLEICGFCLGLEKMVLLTSRLITFHYCNMRVIFSPVTGID